MLTLFGRTLLFERLFKIGDFELFLPTLCVLITVAFYDVLFFEAIFPVADDIC